MKFSILSFVILISVQTAFSQFSFIELNKDWQFKNQKETKWYPASVPGTVHTDLLANKLIPDPYYRDNEARLQWIDKENWEYRTIFEIDKKTYKRKIIELNFDGLDTYADVYLNGKPILKADNMFRGWRVDVKKSIRKGRNELLIKFWSAQNKADSIAKAQLPLVRPDNNRVYVRKAQYHFGWDWGPTFVGCGIWKKITLFAEDGEDMMLMAPVTESWNDHTRLIQQKDAVGTSFYFEKNGKPVYCKGANWIPADMFLPRVSKDEYRKLLLMAKDANMNMLRVWGGGVYEDDYFYTLCDSLGIMVWQDFMFAGGMYPADEAFMNNVREEIRYQVGRLRHHPCIVLWCGNNEIDEAWKNWGWQKQFNLHGADSISIWNDYKRLFEDSLKKWVEQFDGTRPYVSTSPKNGWGHKESFTEGDSHYWGLWWGLEDWEVFETKTGRFISEYGMQSMPNWNSITTFTDSSDRWLQSPVIQAHQKANDGFKKLDHYLTRYFIDSVKLRKLSLEKYTYLTQCLQFYILRNSIATHRSKYPTNMGTLLWQLNDCWPVSSWSITDYSRGPKAAWYAVREAYREDVQPAQEALKPKELKLSKPDYALLVQGNTISISSTENAKYVYIHCDDPGVVFSSNYFDLYKGINEKITANKTLDPKTIRVMSLYDVLYR
ncbi:MAG TPA: hypothetical protein PLZ45_09745 [Ferruginibacter sp.]|nr:glycoside hydrolase [Chitinophagaceae bacterium]HRI24950.1 hypothetical protein [Ferruginibacter sp.]